MDRQKLLKHLVLLMFFIFLVDFLAKYFYWYSLIWYFDMIMHFLGGLWVGMFFIYVLSMKKPLTYGSSSFFRIILCTLIIGILWEIFEFFTYNYIGQNSFDISDTLADIFFDLAGGVLAIMYFGRSIMFERGNKIE